MLIYRFRQYDRVYDTAIEVPDGTTAIPPFHTFEAPPEQTGYYAVMQNGWQLVPGEKPGPPDPPTPVKYVPQSVTRFQAKAILHLQGLLTTAENIINASTDPLVKLVWSEALYFERNSPTLNALAEQLQLTPDQLDDLFIAAEQIVV